MLFVTRAIFTVVRPHNLHSKRAKATKNNNRVSIPRSIRIFSSPRCWTDARRGSPPSGKELSEGLSRPPCLLGKQTSFLSYIYVLLSLDPAGSACQHKWRRPESSNFRWLLARPDVTSATFCPLLPLHFF